MLNNCPSGFRGLHSTVTALLEATNEWAYNIDSGKVNAVMFLDLKEAFDTVDHEILLGKLKVYRVHGIAGNRFRSYLNNRKQRGYVNGHLSSNYRFMHCGVPQRTIPASTITLRQRCINVRRTFIQRRAQRCVNVFL